MLNSRLTAQLCMCKWQCSRATLHNNIYLAQTYEVRLPTWNNWRLDFTALTVSVQAYAIQMSLIGPQALCSALCHVRGAHHVWPTSSNAAVAVLALLAEQQLFAKGREPLLRHTPTPSKYPAPT